MTTIFETTDRDGDAFTVETEHTDGASVRVYVNGSYAYLSTEEVDRFRLALAPYGTLAGSLATAEPSTDLVAGLVFAPPSRSVVKRAQSAALAAAILGEYPDTQALVSVAAFISGDTV